jgi:DNA-binding GntR family transcriptional regulator
MGSMQVQTISGASLHEVIADAIVSGEMAPGSRLDEVGLAERFGVSRTPVREALQRLSMTGLVELRPRRGAIVAMPGPDRLFEMFEVMAELEAMAGRLAARRLTAAARHGLETAHATCGHARGDSDAYYNQNEAFHQAIYAASGSTFLQEQCLQLQRRLSPYRRLQLRYRNRVATSYLEHGEIVAAIARGDEEEASRQLRSHVTVQGARFADLLAALRSLTRE